MRRLLPLGIFLLAFGLRGFLLDNQNIWWDESFSIEVSSLDPGQIASIMDIHPPGYHYLLPPWMALTGHIAFTIRFLSALLGVVAVALVWRLGRELFGHQAGRWAAVLAAVSPFWVAYSQEARMYSMVLVLSLAAVILWYRLIAEGKGGLGSWVGLVAANAAALYTHYSAAFIIAFEGAFLLGRLLWPGRVARRRLGQGLAALGSSLLLYLPWLGVGLAQVAGYGYGVVVAPALQDQLAELWNGFLLGGFAPLSQAWPYLAGAALVMAIAVVLAWRGKPRDSRAPWAVAYGTLYLTIPMAAFLATMLIRPYFHPRYLIVGSPAALLLLGLALATMRRWLAPALATMAVAASLLALGNYYFNPDYAKADGIGVARFLEAEAKEDDLILWETPLPFIYYYRGPAPAYQFRPPLGEEAAELTTLAQGKKRVFWVSWIQARLDPWGRTEFLLDKQGHRLGLRQFRGYDVFWYEVAPHTSFSLGDIKPTYIDFGGRVALTGVAFGGQGDVNSVESGGLAWATLLWKGLRPGEQPLKYYAYLRDETGSIVSQADRLLYNAGRYPPINREREALTGADLITVQVISGAQPVTTPYWAQGEEAVAFVRLPIRPGAPPGEYELEVGVYEADTQRRIGATGASGVVVVGRIQLIPPASPPPPSSLSMAQIVGRRLGALELLGFDPPQAQNLRPGDALAVTLYWRAMGPMTEGQGSVALSLLDKAGQAWGRHQAVPLEGRHPPNQWREGDIFWEQRLFAIPADIPAGSYRLVLESGEAELDLATVQIMERERSFVIPAMQRAVGASFEEGVELLGFDLEPGATLRPGSSLLLTLYWRARAPVAKAYTVFTHFLDADNRVAAQHDSPPQTGLSPTTSWLAGQVVADEHVINLAKDTPAGRYTLEVGLYDPLSGRRLPLLNGQDRVVLDMVEVGG